MRSGHGAGGEGDRLRRVLARTRASLALESFVRAFWPLASGLAFLWAALAFGLAELLARPQLLGLLSVAGLLLLALLVLGLRRFRWPSLADARARVDATLPGRPLAALADAPALGRDDPAALGVWAAHRARMRRLAASARPVAADLRLAAHDPWALRLLALVALIAAGVFARDRGAEAVATVLSAGPGTGVAAGPSFEGWAEPPAYTGRPTLYLPEVPDGAPVNVPEGTKVTLRVYGDPGRFSVAETVSGGAAAALAEAAPGIGAAEFAVSESGQVTLSRAGRTLGSWSFAMEPDRPPEIRFSGQIDAAANGETRLPWAGKDDHGITGATAEIALDLGRVDRRYGLQVAPEPRPALTADLPMPLTGGSRDVEDTLVEDFSKHPFAGLPVTVTLKAEDARGQQAVTAPEAVVLPMRRFYDPLARALVEQRRDLLWSAANARRVTEVLRAVTWQPDESFDSLRAYLVVRAAIRELANAEEAAAVTPAVQGEVAEALWQAAVQIEDGNLGDAKERLARAKERLQQALEQGASDEEVAKLMDELRQATRDYIDQMARDAEQNGDQQAAAPPGRTMTQDQLQQLMDRIQELSEQGRKEEAQALLEMLQQMLDNMQMAQGQGQGGQGQDGQGQQSMQGMADALREQQGLADDSFQEMQRQFQRGRQGQQGEGQQGEGQQGEGQPGQDQGQDGGDDGGTLAERQEALRRLTEQLQGDMPDEAGEAARQALRDAERSMGEARDGLREGDTAQALDRQAEAIDSLRESMRQMGEDMRRAEGEGQGQDGAADGAAAADNARDPLGRPSGSRGSIGTGETMVPEADSAARARALLDEIRRRAGELGRPQLELDYLQRLLDLF